MTSPTGGTAHPNSEPGNTLPILAIDLGERPLVILGVAASDAHVVANHLIAMLLRENNFNVVNLGACTPIEEFMDAYQRHPQAIAIIIGSMNGHAVEDLKGLATAKQNYQVRCPVLLGGNLSVGSKKTSDATERLIADGVDLILDRPEDIIPVLRRLAAERNLCIEEKKHACA